MAFHFQISARLLSWPRKCACCGGAADSSMRAAASKTTGKRVQHTKTSWWEVPYCNTCLAHNAAYESAGRWLWASLIAGVLAWIVIGQASSRGTIGLLMGAAIAGAGFWPYSRAQDAARTQMKSTCCTPRAAVRYLDWHGTFHTFVFESETYTNEFLASNGQKNRSDVQRV
jgi:hypothetical protein